MVQNANIQFKGFSASYHEKRALKAILESLHQITPKDSFINANFTQKANEFRGSIRLKYKSAYLTAKAQGTNLFSVIHDIAHKLKRQISDRKDKRIHKRISMRPRAD